MSSALQLEFIQHTHTHTQYVSFTVFLVQLRLLNLVYYIIIKTIYECIIMLSLEILGMHACIAQLSHHPTGKSIQDIGPIFRWLGQLMHN